MKAFLSADSAWLVIPTKILNMSWFQTGLLLAGLYESQPIVELNGGRIAQSWPQTKSLPQPIIKKKKNDCVKPDPLMGSYWLTCSFGSQNVVCLNSPFVCYTLSMYCSMLVGHWFDLSKCQTKSTKEHQEQIKSKNNSRLVQLNTRTPL